MSASDLDQLSALVRDTAIILDNGEVMWAFADAATAVDDLADAGLRILGLDARNPVDDARATEVPLSISSSTDLEHARRQAHLTLARAQEVTGWAEPLILITWAS
jgi:hypothetical protein